MSRTLTNMSRFCRLFTSMDRSEIRSFLNSFDTIMTDCDGVLWRGNSPIGEAAKVINAFRDLGKSVIYVTNNSTKSRKEFHKKFIDLGFGGDYVRNFKEALKVFIKFQFLPSHFRRTFSIRPIWLHFT
jgi:hypothetical protein